MIYHESPFYSPITFDWTPYILSATPRSCSRECVSKKLKTDNDDVKGTPTTKIIYQDRTTRIQHTDDNQIEFSIDLPGVKAPDIKLEVHDGVLKIHAERKHGNNTTAFERQFLIKHTTDVESSNNIHATLIDGVLQVLVPKKSEDQEEKKEITIPIVAEYPTEKDEKDESKKEVRFNTDLPGVTSSNVTLQVKDDTITLHATRKVFDRVSNIDRHFSFDTNKVDPSSFKAYLMDGVLSIIGTKRDVPEPKQILVKDGSATENMAIETEKVTEETKNADEDMVMVETVTDEK
jgi:HSP20 family molecular chaperone IbpA